MLPAPLRWRRRFCCTCCRHTEGGDWAIELEDFERSEQHYLPNTAVLVTRLFDRHGGAIEIIDFAPRHRANGRLFHPVMLARRVDPLSGSPRIRVAPAPTVRLRRPRRRAPPRAAITSAICSAIPCSG